MPKTRCIDFYADYGQTTLLLSVALHSLQKHYDGAIHVVHGANLPQWYQDILRKHNRISVQSSDQRYAGAAGKGGEHQAYNVRPMVQKTIPFDTRVMYDCDHVFVKPLNPELFDYVEKYGIGSWGFTVAQLRWSGRNKAQYVAEAIKSLGLPCDVPLQPMAGSCVGTAKGSEALVDEWLKNLETFAQSKNGWLASKYVDQHSLSYTMQCHKIPIGDYKWSYSGQSAYQSDLKPIPEGAMAIHFGRGRYRKREADHIFAQALGEAVRADFLGLKTEFHRYAESHSQIRGYGVRIAKEYKPHAELFTELMRGIKAPGI